MGWMERQIIRQAKALKREEINRLSKLVQSAISCDPRLRKRNSKMKRENDNYIHIIKKNKEYEHNIRDEKENYKKSKQLENKEKEKKKRLHTKFEKERERKAIRKIRKSFRESAFAEIERLSVISNNTSESFLNQNLYAIHNDIELICEMFSRKDFDNFYYEQKKISALSPLITLSPLLDHLRDQGNE